MMLDEELKPFKKEIASKLGELDQELMDQLTAHYKAKGMSESEAQCEADGATDQIMNLITQKYQR